MKIGVRYNSPVILTFSAACAIILLLSDLAGRSITNNYFTISSGMSLGHVKTYWCMISYVIGHAGWEHLLGNLSFILLLGPMLEEKFKAKKLIAMMLITALLTGLIHMMLFSGGLHGASGIAFMFIMLSSFSNHQSGGIPLTLVAVSLLFLVKEITGALRADQVSQFAHILGGVIGIVFGFWFRK